MKMRSIIDLVENAASAPMQADDHIRELISSLNEVVATLTLDAGWTKECYEVERAERILAAAESFLKSKCPPPVK